MSRTQLPQCGAIAYCTIPIVRAKYERQLTFALIVQFIHRPYEDAFVFTSTDDVARIVTKPSMSLTRCVDIAYSM